ncbi:MAG: c-type cytochrome [Fimbriiglobus sp.]|nr:c-type cytochrome [Fimbriiglobus sp.]
MHRSVVLLVFALLPALHSADKPAAAPPALAGFHKVTIGKHTFNLPTGFTIELVAASPQVDRPVTAAFDEMGRLFVADSSGDNRKPAEQLKDPTHRIVMLESTKKDGRFDKSTVFADKLSFLQGTMWHAGSLYVATPPTIQKLTDTDGDGKADKREVWFDGGVVGGCANDVHGPYPGPGDGRFYWTKGGFEKQSLTLGNGKKFTTRAAHIYSAKPDGTDLRVEMTGGMDNPVDVAFNAAGELFFTSTFVVHPANGQRDGIIHNTYGAVYGKDHGVLDGHPRTSPYLSPPMTHLGPAAPSGLHCYRGTAFGDNFRDNLFACQFNLAKVSRHILKEKGSTYETIDSDLVTSDNRDFHPTDVIEDADGSLLIIDTGGWYKLCCPSSVMEKKDILGSIYRVRRTDQPAAKPADPTQVLAAKLKDTGLHARRRLVNDAVAAGPRMVPTLLELLADEANDGAFDTALTRAIIDIADPKATREGLKSKSPSVRRAALMALDQMPGGQLTADEVLPHLKGGSISAFSPYAGLSESAWWVADRRPEWGETLVGVFRELFESGRIDHNSQRRVARYAHLQAVQQLLAERLKKGSGSGYVLSIIERTKLKSFPACWEEPFIDNLASYGPILITSALRALPLTGEQFQAILDKAERKAILPWDANTRLRLLSCAPPGVVEPTDEVFAKAIEELKGAKSDDAREALVRAKLNGDRLWELAEALPEVSPVHLPHILKAFARSTDTGPGMAFVRALRTPKLRVTVQPDEVKSILSKYPKSVQDEAAKLYAEIEEAKKELTKKLDTLLADTKPGDVRNGQAVFNSAKAACSACHKIAYVGGSIGPDLTKIGSIRGEKDLLEAIIFPSASFVRSYEPVRVEMKDGRTFNGLLKSDYSEEVTLTLSATEEVRMARRNIEEMKPGTVSIMPAGLDQQLTKQELADLVAFLKSLK